MFISLGAQYGATLNHTLGSTIWHRGRARHCTALKPNDLIYKSQFGDTTVAPDRIHGSFFKWYGPA
jgi:hypothetical protein